MDKIAKIKEYTTAIMGKDASGHGMDHIDRVVANAQNILKSEPQADVFITIAAAFLHDTVDYKLVEDETAAYQQLTNFLVDDIGVTPDELAAILTILKNMSYSKSLEGEAIKLSIEGQIVQDADRLDALGAIGIMRTAYYGGKKGHPIYDPAIEPIDYQNMEDYRKGSTVINHFYEKLLLLSDRMNTAAAKEEAQRRTKFMEEFLAEFYLEWA